MSPAEAQAARTHMAKVYCDGIEALRETCGVDPAIIAAEVCVNSGLMVLARLCGPRVAIEHAYKVADALPLPDAGSAPAPTFKAARRKAFWATAATMFDRAAYAMAGLFIGIWFVLATGR